MARNERRAQNRSAGDPGYRVQPSSPPPRPRAIWPTTRLGWIALTVTILYAALWGLYALFPGLKTSLLTIPYLGTSIETFSGLYVALIIIYMAWTLFIN